MYSLFQMKNDEKTLQMLKQSLEKLNSQSLDGKQSFEEQIKVFKKTSQTLEKMISNHRARIELAKTRRSQWKDQLQTRQAKISQLQSNIGEKDRYIQELKDRLIMAQSKYKSVYSKLEDVRQECKSMESSLDHIEFTFLDEESQNEFSEFQNYHNVLLQEDCERPISFESTSLQSADYQGRQRKEDFNLRIAQQNKQKMRENMKKSRRMIIAGVCSGILKDMLIKIKNSDGMTEQQISQMTSHEEIYTKLDKKMDQIMGMKKNKPALDKYLLTNHYMLPNSLQNEGNNRVCSTSDNKKSRKYSEDLKRIIVE